MKMRLLLLPLLVLSPLFGWCTHLVGGCIELRWLGGDSYLLKVRILRDCENGMPGAYFDNPIAVGIFEKNTHIKKAQYTLNFNEVNDDTLKFTGKNCENIVTGCTHMGTYAANITLNSNTYNSNNGYYLSWQRCCRNGIITNIINPGDAGMCLYTEIPNLKTVKNSTPHFTSNPNTLFCVNNLFEYNMNFEDDDGDELRYSLVDPLNGHLGRNPPSSLTATAGPYPTVVWRNGYNSNNAILGAMPLSIDSTTGKIFCNPNSPGIYVASIRVEEFRFGIKIGEVRLELQITATNCPNTPPVSTVTSVNGQILTTDTLFVEVPQELCIKVRGIDSDDSVYLFMSADSLDSSYTSRPRFDSVTVGFKAVETTVCWKTECELESLNHALKFNVFATDNGCPIARNSSSKFWIRVTPMPAVNPTDLLCMNLVNDQETFVYYGDSTNPSNPYWDYYLVYRGINYQNFSVIDTIWKKGLRFFHDPKSPNYALVNYTYFMRGVNKCGRLGPTSDTLSTFEELEFIPKRQYLKYVTVANNSHLELEWPETPEKDFAKYFLYKGLRNQSHFNLIATFEEPDITHYSDLDVNVAENSYCYYLVMKDTCENYGPQGAISCSMVLTGKAALFMSNLNWQSYSGWPAGVDAYQVHRADPANSFASIGQTPGTAPRYSDNKLNLKEGLFYYYIKATEAFSESTSPYFDAESRSNTIELIQSPLMHIPNAITPNGDGLNDQFGWVPVFVKDFHIQIFNRWGQRVYETTDKNSPWDGKVNGVATQDDVYFYILHYTGWEGTDMTKSGNFTIIK